MASGVELTKYTRFLSTKTTREEIYSSNNASTCAAVLGRVALPATANTQHRRRVQPKLPSSDQVVPGADVTARPSSASWPLFALSFALFSLLAIGAATMCGFVTFSRARPCMRIGFGRVTGCLNSKIVHGGNKKTFHRLGDVDDDDDDDDGDDENDPGQRRQQASHYGEPDELNAYEYDDEFDVHVTPPAATAQSVRLSDGRVELRLHPGVVALPPTASSKRSAVKSLVTSISSPIARHLAHFKHRIVTTVTSNEDGRIMRMQLLNGAATRLAASEYAVVRDEPALADDNGDEVAASVQMVITYDPSKEKAIRAQKRSFITSILGGDGTHFATTVETNCDDNDDDNDDHDDRDEEEEESDDQHNDMRVDANPLADLVELGYDAELRTSDT
jgi:hypothetical protein